MRRPLALFAVLAGLCAARSRAAELSGFVTAITAPDIQVDGRSVQIASATRCVRTHEASGAFSDNCAAVAGSPTSTSFYIGEEVIVQGKFDTSSHALAASKIILEAPSPATINGTAIIDLIPRPQPTSDNERVVRADGYLLRIGQDTRLTLKPPLRSLSEVASNQWIQYSGVQQNDGTVEVSSATITWNKVSGTEDKLRKKTEYDPSSVPDDAHQSGFSKAFIGTDYKRVPPWHDDTMQARVERIGLSLVPAYQRALPEGDPAKITFRFEVIDEKKLRDAVYLPSGIIVVPYQIVDRMQNDDQLAAVLADNIAENIEKDTLHMVYVSRKVNGAAIAGDVAGVFVPGLGIATAIAGGGVAAHIVALQLQQSGRVSLCLLHDAGYDIRQAPLAWWLIAAKPGKHLDETPVPPRAATLYTMLGTTWLSQPVANLVPSPSLASSASERP